MKSSIVEIQNIAPEGHGIGYTKEQVSVHVLGAFPGDIVEVSIYKTAEGINYAEILNIVAASLLRTEVPQSQPFFDANAPWRYLKYEAEQSLKENFVKDIYRNIADIEIDSHINDAKELKEYGYRNKAAYSFIKYKNNIHFALFSRGTSVSGKHVQGENILVHEMINTTGKIFLNFFNQKKVDISILKYLILRYSYEHNCVVAQILVTESNRKKLPWKKAELEKLLVQHPFIQGILVSQSPADTRSALVIKDFYVLGDIHIEERVSGQLFRYHPSQFFQVYPQAFEYILRDCVQCVNSIPNSREYELLDLFAGVGVIGIHLAGLVKSVHGVEQSPLSKTYALENAHLNGIQNFSYSEGDVDELLEYIQAKQILVVDPPRSGLSKQSIVRIQEVLPEYILYISCNPQTQARDVKALKSSYSIAFSKTYNLFPKTPHIEHHIFLKKN